MFPANLSEIKPDLPVIELASVGKYHATENDVKALRNLCRQWRSENEFWEFDAVLDFLALPGGILLFTPEESNPEKWSGLVLARQMLDSAEIIFIYVRPEFRLQKIASRLLTSLTTELQKMAKHITLSLEVKHNNDTAIRLYEKAGLKQVAVRKKYYSTGEDALIYQREI